VLDVFDYHDAFRLIDPVDDPPLRAQPRTPQARQLITQRLAARQDLQEGPVMNSTAAVATSSGSDPGMARLAGRAIPSS